MIADNGVKLVLGSATAFFDGPLEKAVDFLNFAKELGFDAVDTAKIYGNNEELLGRAGAASSFTIDSKTPGSFGPEPSSKDVVIRDGQESLKKVQAESLDVYYIHAPDQRVPWKETLSGLDALHKQGVFKRLGISNFLAHEIDEIVQIAKENNFVVPSVYQGNYSAVARRTENEIFPAVRKHNMAFYVYSPIAGGFLSKSRDDLFASGSRFAEGNLLATIYRPMYTKPSFLRALDEWDRIAKEEGVAMAELAYRWIVYHSKLSPEFGDAVIVGARSQEQLRATVEGVKRGPLSKEAVRRIEEIWEGIREDAPLDNSDLHRAGVHW